MKALGIFLVALGFWMGSGFAAHLANHGAGWEAEATFFGFASVAFFLLACVLTVVFLIVVFDGWH